MFRLSLVGVFVFSALLELVAQPTWKRVYGGLAADQARDIVGTADGGFVVVGSTGSFGNGSSDVYLFKVDEFGARLWSRTIGGPEIDEAHALVELQDGGFLIVGRTNGGTTSGYDGAAWRTDEVGQILWQRSYGGLDWDFVYDVDHASDGAFWLAGQSYAGGSAGEPWVLKLDANGEILGSWTYPDQSPGELRSIKGIAGGGCVAAGSWISANGDQDALVMRIDVNGGVVWFRTFGGADLDVASDIIPTFDGGFSILGSTGSWAPVTEMYHFKVEGMGDLIWERHWGQTNDQEGFAHIELPDGRYATIGYVSQGGAGGKDMFLQIVEANGDFVLGQTQGGSEDDIGRALVKSDGGYVMCGVTLSYGAGYWDVFLVRTNGIGFTDTDDVISSFDPVGVFEFGTIDPTPLHPNPTTGSFYLQPVQQSGTLTVMDASGRAVDTQPYMPGTERVEVNVPTGLYTVLLSTADGDLRRYRLSVVRP